MTELLFSNGSRLLLLLGSCLLPGVTDRPRCIVAGSQGLHPPQCAFKALYKLKYNCNIYGQPRNRAKARPSHLVTKKADVVCPLKDISKAKAVHLGGYRLGIETHVGCWPAVL